ncbi:Plasminogen [Trichinella britovi]|uniref:Plasminogen n=1 Tax=Trichinella britovi TaxID=45882 RepID=A0A0V1CWN8_TRIBR|nr:Plasminogen [Trichinella britovi]
MLNLLANDDNCHNSTASYFRCYLAELDPLLVSLTKTDNNTEKASGCRHPDLSINTHLVSISGPDAENFTHVLNCFIETSHQMVSAALDYVTKNMGIIGLNYDTVKKIQLTDRNPITNARISEIIHINTALEDESLCTEEQRRAAVDCIEMLEKSDEEERQKIQQSICKMKYECFSGVESPCQENVHFNRMSLSQLACGALKFSKFNEQLSSCVGWSVTPEVEPFIDHVLNDLAEPLCEMFILFSDSCSSCGGNIELELGQVVQIMSPNYYQTMTSPNCTWNVHSKSKVVQLHVDSLFTSSSSSSSEFSQYCVDVFRLKTRSNMHLVTSCKPVPFVDLIIGEEVPFNFTLWYSNVYGQRPRAFSLRLSCAPVEPIFDNSQCTETFHLKNLSSSLTLRTPNWPDKFPPQIHCNWTIYNELYQNNCFFQVRFPRFNTLPVGQFIKIQNEIGMQRQISGRTPSTHVEQFDGKVLNVEFVESFNTEGEAVSIEINLITDEQFCYANQIKCPNGGKCIEKSQICDEQVDCEDASDEKLSLCRTKAQCGVQNIPPTVENKPKMAYLRIVNGTQARPGSWPWIASLQAKFSNKHFCGATLISTRWLLTAKHCVIGADPEDLVVRLGAHDLASNTGVVMDVSNVYYIPEHSFNPVLHDIALLKLEQDVPTPFVNNINVACLPDGNEKLLPETPCVAVGWGKTLGTGRAGVLHQAVLPVIKREICNAEQYYNKSITAEEICAGYLEGGRDSAIPEVLWCVLKITKDGFCKCAVPRYPGVYSQVAAFTIQIQFFTALLALFVVVIFYIRIERHFSSIVPSNSERYHFRLKSSTDSFTQFERQTYHLVTGVTGTASQLDCEIMPVLRPRRRNRKLMQIENKVDEWIQSMQSDDSGFVTGVSGETSNRQQSTSNVSKIYNENHCSSRRTSLSSLGSAQLSFEITDDNTQSNNTKPKEEQHCYRCTVEPRICLWENCQSAELGPDEYMREHLERHVIEASKNPSTACCLWKGCISKHRLGRSVDWLLPHVEYWHCGPKPFHCPVSNCKTQFATVKLLERHVNAEHAEEGSSSEASKKRNYKSRTLKLYSYFGQPMLKFSHAVQNEETDAIESMAKLKAIRELIPRVSHELWCYFNEENMEKPEKSASLLRKALAELKSATDPI